MTSIRFLSQGSVFVLVILLIALAVAQTNPVIGARRPNIFPGTQQRPLALQPVIDSTPRFNADPGEQLSGSGPLIFLPEVSYDAGYCFSLAVADVNHDGKADVIAACYGGFLVLLGNGDGTLQPAVGYPSGGEQPFSFAIGDMNHDGKLDLIAANSDTGVVGVLLGNGDGTFKPVLTFPSGGSLPTGVAVGDVNHDGHADVVVVNECAVNDCDSSTLGVLLGRGDGTLQAAASQFLEQVYPNSLALEDANQDGNLDVFIAEGCGFGNCQDGIVVALLGAGDGTFSGGGTCGWKGSGAITSLALANLNGDGHRDLVATGFSNPGQVGVCLGNGDGTFQPALTYETQLVDLRSVVAADVNHDGRTDLLVSGGTTTFALLSGNGKGAFQAPVVYSPPGGPGGTALAIGDTNNDGLPDVLLANGANAIGVLLNNHGAPASTISLAPSVDPVDVREKVTYTAKVATQSGGTLNGIVTLQDGGYPVATVAVANNQASFSTSYVHTQLGAHSITATYGGEYKVATGIESAAATEYIRGAVSTTALTSSVSPSPVGQSVTFTATVTSHSGEIPDGETVTFSNGAAILGMSSTKNGVASLTTSFSRAKTYPIKAAYAGDDVFEPSAKTVQQVVSP